MVMDMDMELILKKFPGMIKYGEDNLGLRYF